MAQRQVLRPSCSLSSFPLCAIAARASHPRLFSCTSHRASQIGRTPLSIPPDVSFKIIEKPTQTSAIQSRGPKSQPVVEIEGPLGKLKMEIPDFVRIDHDVTSRKATVRVLDNSIKQQQAMWGTVRAYLANHILGVSEGHATILRLVGVGYRATVEGKATTKTPEYEGQKFVILKVGYSHPIELPVPQGVKASTPQPTRILLEGPEKEVVNSFAAKIREWRVPEPYKGKGIFVNNETITLKAKKIK